KPSAISLDKRWRMKRESARTGDATGERSGEMVETMRVERQRAAARVAQPQSFAGHDAADPRQRQLETAADRLDRLEVLGGGAEQQLVVVATGQRELLSQRVGQTVEARVDWHRRPVELGADARTVEDVPEVARQPVGQVDRRTRDVAQRQAQ